MTNTITKQKNLTITRVGGLWTAKYICEKCGIEVEIKQDTKPVIKSRLCETCKMGGH